MCGRRFRTFNILDDFNREALAIGVDLNLPVPCVIRVLERAALFSWEEAARKTYAVYRELGG